MSNQQVDYFSHFKKAQNLPFLEQIFVQCVQFVLSLQYISSNLRRGPNIFDDKVLQRPQWRKMKTILRKLVKWDKMNRDFFGGALHKLYTCSSIDSIFCEVTIYFFEIICINNKNHLLYSSHFRALECLFFIWMPEKTRYFFIKNFYILWKKLFQHEKPKYFSFNKKFLI